MDSIQNTAIDQFLTTMNQLAVISSTTISPLFRQKLSVDEKDGKGIYDPVTDADRKAEQVIRSYIEENHPTHSIFGEEFGHTQKPSPYCWIIDPIDGTRAFIMGSPLWGTLIGLTHEGRPLMGMMNQPFTKERFWASPHGAFASWDGFEGAISTAQTTKLSEAIITSTCPDLFETKKDLATFNQLREKCRMTRYGGDCYHYGLLAMGSIDLIVETGLQAYDIVPLIPLIIQAGGVITDWQGKSLEHGVQTKTVKIIAAATKDLHAQALETLQNA